jgi:hypothetical protein
MFTSSSTKCRTKSQRKDSWIRKPFGMWHPAVRYKHHSAFVVRAGTSQCMWRVLSDETNFVHCVLTPFFRESAQQKCTVPSCRIMFQLITRRLWLPGSPYLNQYDYWARSHSRELTPTRFFISVSLFACISAAPTGRSSVKFDTGDFYENPSRKIQFFKNRVLYMKTYVRFVSGDAKSPQMHHL